VIDQQRCVLVPGRSQGEEAPMTLVTDTVVCWSCAHDVDEHDVRGRCLEDGCACGWDSARRRR
jgi:hypothetical protein